MRTVHCLFLLVLASALAKKGGEKEDDGVDKHHGDGKKKWSKHMRDRTKPDGTGRFSYKSRVAGRKLEIKKKDYEVEIKAKAEDKGNGKHADKDELKWEIDVFRGRRFDKERGLQVSFDYKSRANRTETKLNFRTRIIELVEFSGAGDYIANASGQTVLQRYAVGGGGWKRITQQTSAVGNGTLYRWSAVTNDEVVKAVLRLSTRDLTDPNDHFKVSPNAVKLDVEVRDFPFISNSSRLAIIGRIKTKTKQKFRHEREERRGKKNEPNVDTEADAYADELEERVMVNPEAGTEALDAEGTQAVGRFDWNKTVVVNGRGRDMRSVIVTQPDEDGDDDADEVNRDLFFTVGDALTARSNLIVWDPSIGVAYTSDLGEDDSAGRDAGGGASTGLIVGCVAAALVVGGLVARKRQGSSDQGAGSSTTALPSDASSAL